MFTGLVEGTGRLISVEEDGMARLAINAGHLAVGIGMGDSVSVNGAGLLRIDAGTAMLPMSCNKAATRNPC